MNQNEAHRSPMSNSWRCALLLAVLIAAAGGFGAMWYGQEKFDPLLCGFVSAVAAGLAGGTIVVMWFIFRLRCGDESCDNGDD